MAEQRNTSKSVARILQHSILQLCNEHISYSNKLQILGVLCMTVDDEQQELVVKVNNTLKRVGGPAMPKEGVPTVNPNLQMVTASSEEVRSASPSQSVFHGGRKSHGRKGSNPVKVQQVFDDDGQDSSDGEDMRMTEDNLVPINSIDQSKSEETGSPVHCSTPEQSNGSALVSSQPKVKRRMLALSEIKAYGSAKRKSLHQIRVPQFPLRLKDAHVSEENDSAHKLDSSATDNADSIEENLYQLHNTQHHLNVPIYVAGTLSVQSPAGAQDGKQNADMEETAENRPPQRYVMNGPSTLSGSGDSTHTDGEESQLRIKEEPQDDYEYHYSAHIHASFQQHMAALGADSSLQDSSTDNGGLYNCINAYNKEPSMDDGLTIKYTSTGPYTVNSSGKDVSNSSRVKDIILYNDLSPVTEQKGSKIETDYIVDKLEYLAGRKRRRRAPEDQLTPEEIAEYLGQGHERQMTSFKCKYCTEELDDVTKYIQHTLAAHQAYICHQCGKSFTTKSSLLRHRPIHTGMRRFACSICKKTFYRKDKCKAHVKRHLGPDQSVERYTQQAQQIEVD